MSRVIAMLVVVPGMLQVAVGQLTTNYGLRNENKVRFMFCKGLFVLLAAFLLSASALGDIGITTDFSGGNGKDGPNQFPGTAGGGWEGGWRQFREEDERTVETEDGFEEGEAFLHNRIRQTEWKGGRSCHITRRYAETPVMGIDRSEAHLIQMQIRLDHITDDFSHGSGDRMTISGRHTGADADTWAFRMVPYDYGRHEVHSIKWQFFDGDEIIEVPVTDISGAVGSVYTIRVELDPADNSWDAVIAEGEAEVRLSDLNNGESLRFQSKTGEAGEQIGFHQLFRGAGNGPVYWSLNYLSIVPAESGVTLVNEGTPQAVIVLDDEPEFSALYAATMLNRYLKKSTGVELEIKRAGELDDLDPERSWVLLGDSKYTREMGLDVKQKQYGGFEIISAPGGVFVEDGTGKIIDGGGVLAIVGRDYPDLEGVDSRADAADHDRIIRASDSDTLGWRHQRINPDGEYVAHYWNSGGTLYGVIRMLREELGIRWLWPGETGTVVPEHKVVSVGAQHFEDEPAIAIRWIRNRYNYTLRTTYEEDEWWRANFLGKARRFHANHAFGRWKDRYFDDHPEYFGWQRKGQTHAQPQSSDHHWKLCPSEPGVVDQIVENAKNRFENDPHTWTVSVSQGDVPGTGNCFCEACREFDRQLKEEYEDIPTRSYTDGKTGESFEDIINTDRHVAWWNRIGERLAETHPDRYVASWAYGPYSLPPVRERARDNVIVGYVGFRWVSDLYKKAREEWEAWADKAPNMYLRPNVPFGSFSLPHNYTRLMVEDIRNCYETGMMGAEFSSLMGHWATQGLIYYVLAHSLWDPHVNVDELIDDYCESGFGPAAPHIRKYFNLLEEQTAAFRKARAAAAKRGADFPADDYVEVLEEELEPEEEQDDQHVDQNEIREVEGPIDLEAAPNWIARRVRPREIHRLNAKVLMRYYDRLTGLLARAKASVAGEDPEYGERIRFLEKGLLYAYLESDVLLNWYELPRHEVFEKIDRRNAFMEELENPYVVNVVYLLNRYSRYGMTKDFFDRETGYRTDDLIRNQ